MSALNTFTAQCAQTLWAVSWQVGILVGLIWVVSRFSRKASPKFRYLLWCIVLVRLCLPMNLTLPIGIGQYFRNPAERFASNIVEKPATPGMNEKIHPIPALPAENLTPVNYTSNIKPAGAVSTVGTESSAPRMNIADALAMGWFALVVLFGAMVMWRTLCINKLLKECPAIERAELVALCKRLCADLGIKRTVELRYMEIKRADSPAVIGIFRPKVFLPHRIVEKWSLAEIEPILLHELAHIKRADLFVNWLQMILQVIYFFHPLVWSTNWRIRQLREEICDDVAIGHIGAERKRYGRSILRVMEETRREPAFGFTAIGFSERKNSLRRRIMRIMSDQYRLHPKMTLSSILILIAVSLICIVLASETKESVRESHTGKNVSKLQRTATLSNNVKVEIVGVYDYQSKQWWRPDGTPRHKPEYEGLCELGKDWKDENYKFYEFVVRIKGLQDPPFGFSDTISNASNWHNRGKFVEIPDTDEYLQILAWGIPEKFDKTDVILWVTAAKWRTIETSSPHISYIRSSGFTFNNKTYEVSFAGPFERDNEVFFLVSHNSPFCTRVLAIDKQGNIHLPEEWKETGVGKAHSEIRIYKNLSLANIEHFEFQVRPYDRVAFKNVSLKPGKKTDVQVDVECAADSGRNRKNIEKLWTRRLSSSSLAPTTVPGKGTSPSPTTLTRENIQRMIARWNFVEAIPAAQSLLEKATDDTMRARAHLLLARAYGVKWMVYRDATARYEGEKHLEQAFALDPSLKNESGVAHLRAGLLVYRQPKSVCQQPVREAQQEIKKEPNNAQAHFYLGMLHRFLATSPEFTTKKSEHHKHCALAINEMKEATRLAPKRYECWIHYLTVLDIAGRTEEAYRAGERMMKSANLSQELIPANLSSPYEVMSYLIGKIKGGKQGNEYLGKQAQLHPDDVDLQFRYALSYVTKDPTKCRQLFETLLENITSGRLAVPVWRSRIEVSALYKLAHLYNQAGDKKKALDTYKRIVELSPHYAEVRYNRGVIYRSMAASASTKAEKVALLQKAKEEFKAQLRVPWHNKQHNAKEQLKQIIKELDNLGASYTEFVGKP